MVDSPRCFLSPYSSSSSSYSAAAPLTDLTSPAVSISPLKLISSKFVSNYHFLPNIFPFILLLLLLGPRRPHCTQFFFSCVHATL